MIITTRQNARFGCFSVFLRTHMHLDSSKPWSINLQQHCSIMNAKYSPKMKTKNQRISIFLQQNIREIPQKFQLTMQDQRWISKERVTHTPPPSTNKAAHSGFETQRRCKIVIAVSGVSGLTKRSYVLQIFFLKKIRIRTHYILRNTCGLKRGHLIRNTGSWRFRSSVAKCRSLLI